MRDGLAFFVSIWASSAVRLGFGEQLTGYLPPILAISLISLFAKPVILYAIGIYRVYWKYISFREARKLLFGTLLGSVFLITWIVIAALLGNDSFPRSIIGIDFVISVAYSFLVRRVYFK